MFVAAGCAGNTTKGREIKLVPVSGVVKMDGEPLASVGISFMPDGGGTGVSFGATDASGKYVLKVADGREGCEVGKFKVVISKFAKADGSPLPKDLDPADSAAQGMEHLPPNYSDPNSTELRAEVPEGGKTFDFDLKSKAK